MICRSNERERGVSEAVIVASSSRAARTDLGEAVTMKSWRAKLWTYHCALLGGSFSQKKSVRKYQDVALNIKKTGHKAVGTI